MFSVVFDGFLGQPLVNQVLYKRGKQSQQPTTNIQIFFGAHPVVRPFVDIGKIVGRAVALFALFFVWGLIKLLLS